MYKLICMGFDGEFKTESPEFETIQDAWEYSGDMGNKWYFYPFHFVVTASGLSIADAPEWLDFLTGCRVKTVVRIFERASKEPRMRGADCDEFMAFLRCQHDA